MVHDLFFCVDWSIASQLALDKICDFLDDFLDRVSWVLVISSKDVGGLCEHIFKRNWLQSQWMFRCRNKCQILESSFNSALGNEILQFGVIRQVNLFLSLFHLENPRLNEFFAELGLLVLGVWRRINLEEVLKRMVDGVFKDLLPLVDLNVTRCGVVVADRCVRLEGHKLLKNREVFAFN